MRSLLSRVLAFVLGMVFTLTAVVGAVVGGTYWAYKNLKPIDVLVEDPSGLGDLKDQSVEDLLLLLQGALEDPDSYTFDRLQGEYGLDLEKLLNGLGIENVDTNSKNWDALLGISLFNAKDGIEPLLDSVKVRALYNFLPSLAGKELDDILSKEAQEKLGDYSIMELIKSDETTGELGLIKAMKSLKIGALLPEYFNSVYDPVTHEYTYVLDEDSEKANKLPALSIVGNVSLDVVSSLMAGEDVMAELMDGSLSSITEMPIEDILNSIVATVSPELAEKVGGYFKVLNGATIKDLFVPNSEGGYDFYYVGVLGDLELGYLLGLTDEDGDGVWVNAEGEPASELMQVLANMDIGAVLEEENTIELINELIGDVNVGMILDTIGIEEGQIAILDALRGLEVGKILAGQTEEFDVNTLLKALVKNLNESFGDTTLGDLIGMENTGNVLLDELFELRIADLLLEEYTLENIIEAFRNAIGTVSVGDILGYEKDENGAWVCDNELIVPILDFSFDNIFDAITSDLSASEIVKALLPETTVGEIASAILGVKYDEERGAYYKETENGKEYFSDSISEVLNLKIADIVESLTEKDSPIDVYDELLSVKTGDILDSVLTLLDKDIAELTKGEDGSWIWAGDKDSGTSEALNSSLLLIVDDLLTGGNKLLDKDVDLYINILEDATNLILSVAGLSEKVPPELIDDVFYIFENAIDCKLGEIGDADIEWVQAAVAAALVVVDHVYPEEERHPIVKEIIVIIKEHLDEGTFSDFPQELLAVEIDRVIDDVFRVLEVAFPEQLTLLNDVEVTLKDMFRGTIGEPALDGSVKVKDLIADAKELSTNFIISPVLDAAFDEIAKLYGDTVAKYIFSEIKNFTLDDVIEAIFNVLEVAFPEEKVMLADVEVTLKDMFRGTIGEPALDGSVKVADLVNDAKAVVNNFVQNNVINAAFDEIAKLYGDTVAKYIFSEILNFALDDVIEAIFNVLEVVFPEQLTLLNDVEVTLKDMFRGTIGEPALDGSVKVKDLIADAKELSTNFIISPVLDAAFDEIAKLYGDTVAKYIFSEIKNFTLDDVIEAIFNVLEVALPEQTELLNDVEVTLKDMVRGTIGEPALDGSVKVSKLVNDAKTVVNNFVQNDIINAAFDEIAKLYGDTVAKYIFSEIKNFALDDVIESVFNVLEVALPEQITLLNDVEVTLKDMVRGTIGEPALDGSVKVKDLIADAKELSTNFIISPVLDAAFDEIAKLYGDTVAKYIFSEIKNFALDDVIEAIFNVLEVAFPEEKAMLADVEVTLKDMFRGTIGEPALDGSVKVADLVNDAKAVVNNFVQNNVINAAFDEIVTLYGDTIAKYIFSEIKNFTLDDVIESLANVVSVAVPEEKVLILNVKDTLQDMFRGTIGAPALDGSVKVAKLVNDAKAVVNNFVQNDIINAAFDEIAKLYGDTIAKYIFSEIKNFALDDVIGAIFNVLEVALPEQSELLNDVEVTLKDMVRGTIGEPALDGSVKVADLVNDAKAIVNHIIYNDIINKAFDEIAKLYGDTVAKYIFSEIKNFTLDDVIESVFNVLEVAFPEQLTLLNDVEVTLKDMFRGTIGEPALDGSVKVKDLIADAKELSTNFIISPVLDAAFDEIAKLYGDTIAKYIFSEIKNFTLDDVIEAIINVLEVAFPEEKAMLADVEVTLKDMFRGTIGEPALDGSVKVADLVNDAKAVVNNFVQNNVINAAFDEIVTLYGDTIAKYIFSEIKNFTLDDVIESLANVVSVAVPEEKVLILNVKDTLQDMFRGTIGEPALDGRVKVAKLVNDAKAVVNNFVQNDIINAAFDEIAKLYGDTIAKYIFSEIKNFALDDVIGAIFNVLEVALPEQSELLNDVEVTLKDMVRGTIGEPALDGSVKVADLVNDAKTVVNNFVQNDIINAAFDEIAKLYGDTVAKYIFSEIKNFTLDDVIESVFNVLEVAFPEQLTLLNDVEVTLKDMFRGTIGEPALDGSVKVKDLIADAKELSTNFIISPVLDAAFDEIAKLYGEKQAKYIFSSIPNFLVDEVIEAIINVLEVAFPEQTELLTDVETLLKDVLGGTLGNLGYQEKVFVNTLISDIKEIVANFTDNEALFAAFDEVARLYAGVMLKDIVDATMNLYVDLVIDAVISFAAALLPEYGELFEDISQLLKDIFGGTISKPGYHENTLISKLVADVKAIVLNFTDNEIVMSALSQITFLYVGETIDSFVDATMGLELDSIVDAVANVVTVAIHEQKDLISAIASFAQNILDGTVAEPAIVIDYTVGTLINEVQNIANVTVEGGLSADINDVIDAIENLFIDVTFENFVNDTLEITVDDTVSTVFEIVAILVPEQAKFIGAVETLLVDLMDGTLGAPVLVDETLTLGTFINDLQATANEAIEGGLGEDVNQVIDILEGLVAEITIVKMGEDILELKLDDIAVAVTDAVGVFMPDYSSSVIKIQRLITSLVDGTIGEPVFIPSHIKVGKVINDVQSIVKDFVNIPEEVNATIDQIEELFADVKIRNFVEDVKEIAINDVVSTVADIVVIYLPEYTEVVVTVRDLINDVIQGTIGEPVVISDTVTVGELIGDVQEVINGFVDLEETNEIIDAVEELFADVRIKNFVEDALMLDVDEIIDVVDLINEKLITNSDVAEIISTVTNIAHEGLSGTLGDLKVDGEAAWNAVPEEVKPYIIGAGVAAGIVMYFVANDTLVELAGMALGEDATLGEFIAEPMGFAADYTFEGEQNALATAIFNTKVVEILNDEFDFKAAYYDLLTVEDIMGIADAVLTKYVANEIADVAIEGLAVLYGDTHIVDEIEEATLALLIDDVIAYAADVISAALPEYEEAVADVEILLVSVFGGTIGEPGYEGDLSVSELVLAIKEIVENFTDDAVVMTAFDELAQLYTGVAINEIAEGTRALYIDLIVDAVSNVLVVALPEYASLIEHIEKLIKDAFGGTVGAPGYHETALVSTLILDVNEIVLDFAPYIEIDAVFTELAKLYEGVTVANIVDATLAFEIDAVIDSLLNVANVILPEHTELSASVATLLKDLFGGTIGAPGYHGDVLVSRIIIDVKGIVLNFTDNAALIRALDRLVVLYNGVQLNDFVSGTLAIEIDALIEAIASVATAGLPEHADLIADLEKLGKDVFGGTIGAPGAHSDLLVDVLANDVKAVAENFTSNAVLTTSLDEIAKLYEGVFIMNFVDASLALELDSVIESVFNVLEVALPEQITLLNDVEVTLKDMVRGTIGEPALDGSVKVKDLIADAKELSTNFIISPVLDAAFDEIAKLYGDTVAKYIFSEILNFALDDVIESVFNVLEVALPEQSEILADVEVTLKDMFRGTIGEPALDGSVKVADLVNDAKAVVNNFVQNDIINAAFDEIAKLYGDTVAKYIFSEILNFALDNVIASIANVVSVAVPEYQTLIRDIEALVVEMVDGTIGAPTFNDEMMVSDLANQVKGIVTNYTVEPVVMTAFDEIAKLYSGIMLKDIVSGTLGLYFDLTVDAVENVLVVALPEQAELINDVATLVKDVLGGQLENIGYHENALVSELVSDVKEVVNDVVVNEIANVAMDELAVLYEGVTIGNVVGGTLAIKVDNAVVAVANTVKVALPENVDKVTHVEDLICYIVAGTIGNMGIESTATVGKTLDLVKEIALDYAPYTEVEKVFDELSTLTKDVVIVDFVNGVLALDVDEVITTVNDITDIYVQHDVLDTIYNIAHEGMDGTLGNLQFNGEAAWNAVPEEVKPYIIGAGVAAGIVMYFVANDTLVELAGMALGEDATLGELIAEPMGFAADYTFEGEQNALATAIFDTKVVEILNDEFDFKAAYYDLLTVEDIMGIADAIVTKYVANEIADAAIEGLAALYGDTHIVDEIVDATLGLYLDDIIAYAADVISVALPENADVIADVETLLTSVLEGTVKEPGYKGITLVSELILEVKDIVDNFTDDATVLAVFTELAKLYEGVTINDFVSGTLAIEIDAVIDAVANVVSVALPENVNLITAVATLLKDVLGGTIETPGYHGDALVSRIIIDVKGIALNFTDNAVLMRVFDKLVSLYSGVMVKDIVSGTLAIEIDDVIDAIASVASVALPEKTDLISDVVKLGKDVFGGTVGAPGAHSDLLVDVLANDVKAVVSNYTDNAIIATALDEIAKLYEGVFMMNFVDASLALDFDETVDSVANVVVTGLPEQAELINDVATLIKDTLGGTIGTLGYHGNVLVSRIIIDLKGIALNFTDNAALIRALDRLVGLYNGIQHKDFVSGTLAIDFDELVDATASVLGEAIPEQAELFKDIAELAKDLFGVTVGKFGYHSDASISELIIDVKAIAENFTDNAVVMTAFDELAKVYDGVTVEKIVDGTLAIKVDNAVVAVANTVKVALPENVDKVTHVEDLICYIVAGTLGNMGIEAKASVGKILDLVKEIALDYAPYTEVEKVFDELSTLTKDVVIVNFVNDFLSLGVDDTITTINNITDIYVQHEVLDNIYNIAHEGMDGTLGNIQFNGEAAWNAVPENAKPYVIAAGVAAGAVMYFVANDALVSLAVSALGEEATLGDFIAEPAGFEVSTPEIVAYSASGKVYTFEGEQNALATAIFDTKVVDILNDEFDFKAAYYDLLTVENILGIVDAIVTKYVPNDVANAAIEEVALLYGDTHVVEIVDATLGLYIDLIVDGATNVISVALPEQANLISDVATLIKDVFGGTVKAPGYHGVALISDIIGDVKAIAENFTDNAVVMTAFDELAKLYDGVTINNFAGGTLAIEIDAITDSTANVISVALPENVNLITAVATLLKDVLGGTVETLGYHGDALVSRIVIDVKGIALNFTDNAVLMRVFDKLVSLYSGVMVKDIVSGTLAIEIDAVIDAVASVASVALPEKTDLISDVAKLGKDVFGGTIGAPGAHSDLLVDVLANDVKAVAENFTSNAVFTTSLDEVAKLYEGVFIMNFVEATKELSVDASVSSVASVAKVAVPEHAEKVENVENFIVYTVAGTLAKFGIETEAKVNETLLLANEIALDYAPYVEVDSLFNEVAALYGDEDLLVNIVDATKAIEIDKAITAAANLVTVMKVADGEIIADVATTLKDALRGTVSAIELDGTVKVATLINDAKAVTNNFVQNNVINAAFDELAKLYGETLAMNIFKAIPEFEVDAVIDALANVAKVKLYDKVELVDSIATTLKDALRGTLGAIELDGTVKAATLINDAKAVTNNFVQNNVVNAAFDEIATLYGDTLAMNIFKAIPGFEVDAVIDALANVAKVKLYDKVELVDSIATTLKDALRGTVSAIELDGTVKVATLINDAKAVTNNFVQNNVVNAAFDEIATLYGETLAMNIFKAITEFEVDVVIESAANVVSVAVPAEKTLIVNIATTLKDALRGTLGAIELDGTVKAATLINDAKAVVNHFVVKHTVNAAFDELAKLYGDTLAMNIFKAIPGFEVDAVIDALANVAKVKLYDKVELVDSIATTLKDALRGTLGAIELDGTVKAATLINDAKAVVNHFVVKHTVNAAFDELAKLYGDTLAMNIFKAIPGFEVDAVIDVASNVLSVFRPAYAEKITHASDFVKYLAAGTLGKFGIEGNSKVGEALTLLKVVALDYAGYREVETIFNELAELTKDVKIANFKNDFLAIEVQAAIVTLKGCLDVVPNLNDSIARIYEILEIAVTGTLGNPNFHAAAVWNNLSETEKVVVAVAGVGIAAGMYFMANDVLVALTKKAVAESTWGELLADKLGYELTDGQYHRSGVVNSFVDTLFAQKVHETLTKGWNKYIIFEHITLGNLMTITAGEQAKFEDLIPGTAIMEKTSYVEWTVDNSAQIVFDILLNVSAEDVLDNSGDLKGYLIGLVEDLRFADFVIGRKLDDITEIFGLPADIKAERTESGDWSFEGPFAKFFNVTLNYTLGDAINAAKGGFGGVKTLVFDAICRLTIGDLLGEGLMLVEAKAGTIENAVAVYNAHYDEATGKWTSDGQYAKLIANLCNENLYDFVIGLRTSPKNYLLSEKLLGGLYIGELIDGNNSYDEATDTWMNRGAEVVFESGLQGTMTKTVYELKISDILSGNLDLSSLITDMYLGEVLGYACKESEEADHVHDADCAWTKDGVDVNALTNAIATIKLNELTDGGVDAIMGKVESLNIGDVFQYTKGEDGKWYNGESEVEGLLGKLCGYTLKEVKDDFDTIIKGFMVGDVLIFDDSSILTHLKDTKISDLEIGIKALYIGDVMGYTKGEDGKWYNGEALVTDELISILVDYKIGDLKGEGFSDKLIKDMSETVKISKFMPYDSCEIFGVFTESEYNSLTINQLSTALEEKLNKNISLGTLVDIGIIDTNTMMTAERQAKILTLYNNTNSGSQKASWRDITFLEFFTIAFGALDNIPA